MRRTAPWAGLAFAALASVSSTAQVLTAPLAALPAVRLTDSCSTVENNGVAVTGDTMGLVRLVNAVNDSATDLVFRQELWWPTSARMAGSPGNAAILGYGPFQDTTQIAAALKMDPGLFTWGVRDASVDGFACFATSPPPELKAVAEFQSTRGEYRLAVGGAEAASLSADGWTATGDTYHVLASGNCYGGDVVFRFARAQADWRSGRFLTMDAAECGRVRNSDPTWRPYDAPFASQPPVGGLCNGQYSAIEVYGLELARGLIAGRSYRFTSNPATYDAMITQGWTGRGVAFCAVP